MGSALVVADCTNACMTCSLQQWVLTNIGCRPAVHYSANLAIRCFVTHLLCLVCHEC